MAGDSNGNGRLLQEVEALSKALCLDGNLAKSSHHHSSITSRTKIHHLDLNENSIIRTLDEKASSSSLKARKSSSFSSLWNWKLKPFAALSSHNRSRRFNCCFSLHVHSIKSLPYEFQGLSLQVHFKCPNGRLETRPAKVFEGISEFEETLAYNCSISGKQSGPGRLAKYEAKNFLLYAKATGASNEDLGKHRIDLTRLLPLSLEELEEEEKNSGKWTTSFQLSGKAKGSILIVSFGFFVQRDDGKSLNSVMSKLNWFGTMKPLVGLEALPSSRPKIVSLFTYDNFDDKPVSQVFTDKDRKADPDPLLKSMKEKLDNGCEDDELTVIEQRTETAEMGEMKGERNQKIDLEVETIKHEGINKYRKVALEDPKKFDQHSDQGNNLPSMELFVNETYSASRSCSDLEVDGFRSPPRSGHQGKLNYMESESMYKDEMGMPFSLDGDTESVVSEFLSMLTHSPFCLSLEGSHESPKERQWKQFKRDSLASGVGAFGLDSGGEEIETQIVTHSPAQFDLGKLSGGFELSSIINAAETEHKRMGQAIKNKTRAKMLEEVETEALMQEWGLNKGIFERSLPDSASGFGSPMETPLEKHPQLPAIGEGLGPFVQLTDGGFLRSMSPSLFPIAKSNGSLMMQVSSPIVVPVEMGSGIMEILRHLASEGIEKFSKQASKLMPLEDITRKTIQKAAWEALPSLKVINRQGLLHQLNPGGSSPDLGLDALCKRKEDRDSSKLNLSSFSAHGGSEYVSLEDLVPLAMEKIEALSIEGLRVQSGMFEETHSSISAQCNKEVCTMKAKSGGSLDLEGAAGLQLLDIKDANEGDDGLMSLSLSLDKWMRLDAGIIDEEEQTSSRMSKILAAHHANCTTKDLTRGEWKGDNKGGTSRKWGILGNNFTVALMVQLRDPLRNYEPVGTRMLALIQVERVFVCPKPEMYSIIPKNVNSVDYNRHKHSSKEGKEDKKEEVEAIPRFKITEIHVSGIKTEPSKKKVWGTSMQQQAGSRWLLARGMGKSPKHPFMKSSTVKKLPR